MILPNLPSKFSSGETLTAAKLNAMIDWMRDIARILPSLQVNTGRGLVYSRSSAGTTISLAHGYIQGSDSGDEASTYVPPFAVSVAEDGSATVAPGSTVSITTDTAGFTTAATFEWGLQTFPPGSVKAGGGIIITNPFPDGGMSIVDNAEYGRGVPPHAIIIAIFISDITQPGAIRVKQLIRSDLTFVSQYKTV